MTAWTTKEQETWLRQQVPAYRQAKASSATSSFYPKVYQGWREKWPTPAPTAEEVAAANNNPEVAAKGKRVAEENRIRQWFYNHSKKSLDVQFTGSDNAENAESKRLTRGVLKLSKPRMLHHWQAYQQLTYETKWKPVIEKGFASYVKDWNANNPGRKPEMDRFAFMTKFMMEKWEEVKKSDPEMVEKVEEYRQNRKKKDMEHMKDGSHEQMQQAINKLPKTLLELARTLNAQTGWNFSIYAGGPEPRESGRIRSMSHHFGATPNGLHFSEWEPDTEEDYCSRYGAFLCAAFPKDVRAKYVASGKGTADSNKTGNKDNESVTEKNDDGKQPASSSDRKEEGSGEGHEDTGDEKDEDSSEEEDEDSSDEEDESSSSHGKGSGSSAGPTKSAYEIEREKNIETNNKILEALGLKNFSITGPLPVRSKEKQKAPQKIAKATRRSERKRDTSDSAAQEKPNDPSITISTSKSTSVATSSTSSESVEVAQTSTSVDTQRTDVIIATTNTSDDTKTSENAKDYGGDKDKIDGMDGQSQQQERSCDHDEGQKDNGEEKDVGRQPADEDGDGDVVMNDGTDVNKGTSQSGNLHLEHPITPPASDQPPISPSAPTKPHSTATSNSSIPNEVSIDPAVLKNCPTWLEPTLTYLLETSENSKWQELVKHLVSFESSNPVAKQLATTSRPKEVQTWVKRHKHLKSKPMDVDLSEFPSTFNAWWRALQPDWRREHQDDATMPRTPPSTGDSDWTALAKGGNTGIYTLIMALSWWVRSTPAVNDDPVWSVVDDIKWVLGQIHTPKCASRNSKKRPSNAAGVSDSRKRHRK
ncbi:hypothetical protein CVT24_011094 [Panaeolus cyanescens]|uniref:Uncharacterized protein n=1 Tax=Panaeolus cyanescens TaxID=181874 RepID=A0A409YVK3_9AGAR|nr:hypothetical protein CVT24_011094 [Panaeolus cyanescens]